MLAKERQIEIESMVLEKGSMTVKELSSLFDVSEVTVRKDLEILEQNNRLVRTHGGAMTKYQSREEFPIESLAGLNVPEKQIIARKSIEYIEDGDSILLDGSSTTCCLMQLLTESGFRHVTVITPSSKIVQIARESDIDVVVIGGFFNKKRECAEGIMAERQIQGISADKCFMGVNGIDANFGISVPTFPDAATKYCMCKAAKKIYVIADYTKFNKKFMAKAFDFEDGFNVQIITDSRHKSVDYQEVEKKVNIIYAQ